MQPVGLKLVDDRTLQIDWSDGQSFSLKVRSIRDRCPCATCREKSSKPADPFKILQPQEIQPLKIESMKPAGNYGYVISFSDGHHSGIFSFDLLRSACEATEQP